MAIQKLSDLAPFREAILELAKEHKASNVRVFGSVARGEAKAGSDVDFLVDFSPEYRLRDLIRLTQGLKQLLGQNVEVAIEAQLREELRPNIMGDAVPL